MTERKGVLVVDETTENGVVDLGETGGVEF